MKSTFWNLGLLAGLLLITQSGFADWHEGKIELLAVGYDGTTIMVDIESWSRSDCTCYPTWPTYMCLDANRSSNEFEQAMLLSAYARGGLMRFQIDEASCMVNAMYEAE